MNIRGIHIIKVLFISCCLIVSTAQINLAQESQLWFEHLQMPGGDQASFVSDIAQDSLGFMWFSTWNGLYRYDGYSFTNFTHNPADSTSIGANWVETLYVDKKGTLWAGTYGGGLNRFNSETETFTHYQNDPGNPTSLSQDSVTVILEDHRGDLWVGTMDGLNRFDRETETFEHFQYDPDDPTSINNNQVRALYEDRQGTLWVGLRSHAPQEDEISKGPGGLSRFNRETGTFTNYVHDPNDSTSLIDNHLRAIYEDTRGTFWVGTAGDGLHTMNRTTGTFTRHRTDFDNPDKLSRPYSDTSEGFTNSDLISFIMEDQSGAIWMGSAVNIGINRYNPETGNMTRFNPSMWDRAILWDMFQSRDGTLWLATIGDGVWKIQSRVNSFEDKLLDELNSTALLQYDRSDILWTGTTENFQVGLNAYADDEDGYTLTRRIEPEIIGGGSAFYQTRDDTYWLGFYWGSPTSREGELYRKPPSSDEFTSVLGENTGEVGPVTVIHEDGENQLWFGTKWTGLFRLSQQDGNLTNYSFNPGNSNSLTHTNVTALYESSSEPNILWIGTEGGLNRLDRNTETITTYLDDPGSTHISSLEEDASGVLWIATFGDGLYAYEREEDTFTQFTTFNSGLPDSHVLCLLGDDNGYLWMSTGDDITRFNPDNRSFYTFSGENAPNVGTFANGTCAENGDGEFAFGSMRGFTTFHPDQMLSDEKPPDVVFTAFILNDQPNQGNSQDFLHKSISQSETITLKHNQNTFSVEFAALDYRAPESNHYMYQLEGYDTSWLDGGTQRRASYKRIPPGEYLFKVKAANSVGVWSEQGVSIPVTILPPWWRTWWAYGLYGLLLIAGILAADRIQRKRFIAKERERARERELEQEKAHARQLEEAYSDLEDSLKKLTAAQDQLVQQEKLASLGQLTAGIAHEIKNPLNFVNNFSDLSIELVEEAREELSALSRQHLDGTKKSPLEGSAEAERRRGVSDEATNYDLILEILNDIEMNLRKIHEHGTRADNIVKSMLQHSRGGTGKVEPTDINALIKEYVNLAFHGMRASKNPINVDIDLNLDENAKEIPLIAEDFSRVILNLCNNAFDAMREKLNKIDNHSEKSDIYLPKLNVSTKREDGYLRIEIQDNGPGIPSEFREKILQPFFTTKKGKDGTGLGLSITNDIVKSHGGNIDIRSESGNYTSFSITIPYKNQ